jgi:hypothetical protein
MSPDVLKSLQHACQSSGSFVFKFPYDYNDNVNWNPNQDEIGDILLSLCDDDLLEVDFLTSEGMYLPDLIDSTKVVGVLPSNCTIESTLLTCVIGRIAVRKLINYAKISTQEELECKVDELYSSISDHPKVITEIEYLIESMCNPNNLNNIYIYSLCPTSEDVEALICLENAFNDRLKKEIEKMREHDKKADEEVNRNNFRAFCRQFSNSFRSYFGYEFEWKNEDLRVAKKLSSTYPLKTLNEQSVKLLKAGRYDLQELLNQKAP